MSEANCARPRNRCRSNELRLAVFCHPYWRDETVWRFGQIVRANMRKRNEAETSPMPCERPGCADGGLLPRERGPLSPRDPETGNTRTRRSALLPLAGSWFQCAVLKSCRLAPNRSADHLIGSTPISAVTSGSGDWRSVRSGARIGSHGGSWNLSIARSGGEGRESGCSSVQGTKARSLARRIISWRKRATERA